MWEAQGEMAHITGKLVNPEDFRSKAEIEKERKLNERKMR